jgi:hypothetical protein
MKIDFRLPLDSLTSDELTFLSTQVRFATRFHDAPLAGVRIELVPDAASCRARVTAIEQGGATVVAERDASTTFEAVCEATWVLDRALHGASMARRDSAQHNDSAQRHDWAA